MSSALLLSKWIIAKFDTRSAPTSVPKKGEEYLRSVGGSVDQSAPLFNKKEILVKKNITDLSGI